MDSVRSRSAKPLEVGQAVRFARGAFAADGVCRAVGRRGLFFGRRQDQRGRDTMHALKLPLFVVRHDRESTRPAAPKQGEPGRLAKSNWDTTF